MGIMKHVLDEQDWLRRLAIAVLCTAGVMKECEFHDEVYLEGSGELEAAYKLAHSSVTTGEILLPAGTTRRDFTDLIKEVYADECAAECYFCSR